jgi:hypothetical protein
MSMLEARREEDLGPGSTRSFGLTFAVVFLIAAAIALYLDASWWIPAALAAVGAVFGAVALVAPRALSTPNLLWFRFGILLATITQPLMLGVIFFLAITPIGLFRRALGADPMRRRRPARGSLWILRDESAAPVRDEARPMTRQF